MNASDLLKELSAVGQRFHGVDLQFRRSGTEWPMAWRVTLVATKNERADFRMVAYGQTAEDAVRELLDSVAKFDAAQRGQATNPGSTT